MFNNNICKFFLKNNCTHGDKCKFIHDKSICRDYFLQGVCKRGNKCKFTHKQDKKNGKKHIKNTENFNPSYKLPDMNILVGSSNSEHFYQSVYGINDVIIVPNFLQESEEKELYNNLIKEMKDSNINEEDLLKLSNSDNHLIANENFNWDDLWKLWHGNNHLIADDNLNWKDKVPTFGLIIKKIESYFNMHIESTRVNLYKDSNDWKPYHHDAAAVKEHIAKKQNFTVGISLGATRNISFENVKSKQVVSIALPNLTAYAFSKNVNIEWKHGVPQIDPSKFFNEGRISIIAWGLVNME
jgi:hypothetical protein